MKQLSRLLGVKFRTQESWKRVIRSISHSTPNRGDRFDKMSECGDYDISLWYTSITLDPDAEIGELGSLIRYGPDPRA